MNVYLADQPWSDGNPIRSALGRRIGRTSVPAIFINGVYIGGCDDGPSADAPGLIPLAFQGDLSLPNVFHKTVDDVLLFFIHIKFHHHH